MRIQVLRIARVIITCCSRIPWFKHRPIRQQSEYNFCKSQNIRGLIFMTESRTTHHYSMPVAQYPQRANNKHVTKHPIKTRKHTYKLRKPLNRGSERSERVRKATIAFCLQSLPLAGKSVCKTFRPQPSSAKFCTGCANSPNFDLGWRGGRKIM